MDLDRAKAWHFCHVVLQMEGLAHFSRALSHASDHIYYPAVIWLSKCSAEYRRMKPFLDSAGVEAWALDLLGNGFCASGLEGRPNAELGPDQRRQHLYAFWKQKVGADLRLTF